MENQEEQAQNQQEAQFKDKKGKPLTGAALVAAQKAADIAAQNAEANAGDESKKSPVEAAKEEALTTGESEEQRIANAFAAVRRANPDLSLDEVSDIVAKVFKKTEPGETKVAKQAATIIDATPEPFKEKIYLKKDVKKQYPLEKEALNGVVVYQTYKKTTEEGDEITVPARNLNPIAIYSQEDFDRLNHGNPKKPGFAREGLTVEVWHKPGQKDSVAE